MENTTEQIEKKAIQTMFDRMVELFPNIQFNTIWIKEVYTPKYKRPDFSLTFFYNDLTEDTNQSFEGVEIGSCYERALKFFHEENEIQRLKKIQKHI